MSLNIGAKYTISANVEGQAQIDRLAESLKKTGAQGEASAGQIRQAMRMLPAQFTDIAVSLQGGQSPFTVLLQQGGQIRDQFGSVGAALRGIGSVISPAALGIAGLGSAVFALGKAYADGSAEADRFRQAIVGTGNAAGVTTDQLAGMAAAMDRSMSGVTQGKASEALAALVATGQVGRRNLEEFARAAVDFESKTGQAVSETARQFAALGRDPVNESRKLNEQINFLTADTYRLIRAAEESGDKQRAAALAQDAYASAIKGQSKEIGDNLGTLERAWAKVRNVAAESWDAMLGIGRSKSVREQIKDIEKSLSEFSQNESRPLMVAEQARLRERLAGLQEVERLARRAGDATAERLAAEKKGIDEIDKKYKDKGKVSEFDQLKRQYEDQLLSIRELGVAETLLAQIQSGRFKELTKAQQNDLVALARRVDGARIEKEAAEAEQDRQKEVARMREREEKDAARLKEAEDKRLESAREKWIDLIDPVNKYIRQIQEIRALVSAGKLTPEQGFEAEFRVQEQIDDLGKKGKETLTDLEKALSNWGQKATDTFIDFAFTGKASFKDLVNSVLQDIARMLIQKNVTKPLFDAISGGFNSGGFSGIFSAAKSLFGFANGGVMTGAGPMPLRAYAAGGIAKEPQLALYGEGSMNEAFVPLPDGRSIPVTMKGGAGGVYNITVPVTVDGAGSPAVADAGGAGALGKAIAAAVRSELINQKRPGGLLAA